MSAEAKVKRKERRDPEGATVADYRLAMRKPLALEKTKLKVSLRTKP